jgi:hypothetical protein
MDLIKTDGLIFEENSHTYTLDGKPVPSMSALLKMIPMNDFIRKGWWKTEDGEKSMNQSAEHGTLVHDSLEKIALGESESSVLSELKRKDDELRENFVVYYPDYGYKNKSPIEFQSAVPLFKAVMGFIKDSGFEIVAVETKVANKELHYCGTFDLLLRDKNTKKLHTGDYKTSRYKQSSQKEKVKKYGIQMSGYTMAMQSDGNDISDIGILVWLMSDGYKLFYTPPYNDTVKKLAYYANIPEIASVMGLYNSGLDEVEIYSRTGITTENIKKILNALFV